MLNITLSWIIFNNTKVYYHTLLNHIYYYHYLIQYSCTTFNITGSDAIFILDDGYAILQPAEGISIQGTSFRVSHAIYYILIIELLLLHDDNI